MAEDSATQMIMQAFPEKNPNIIKILFTEYSDLNNIENIDFSDVENIDANWVEGLITYIEDNYKQRYSKHSNLDMPGGRKRKRKTKKIKKKSRKRRKKRKTRRRKKQKGGDKANKYWGRKGNFLSKYALPNLLPKKIKKDLWLYRTAKYGVPLPWKN
jgi:hypothetical protein